MIFGKYDQVLDITDDCTVSDDPAHADQLIAVINNTNKKNYYTGG